MPDSLDLELWYRRSELLKVAMEIATMQFVTEEEDARPNPNKDLDEAVLFSDLYLKAKRLVKTVDRLPDGMKPAEWDQI